MVWQPNAMALVFMFMVSSPEEFQWSSYNQYIGNKKAEEWLARDFILGYFGKNYITAQRQYHNFVTNMIGQEYKNPLDEVIGSVLLGGHDFVNFIKERYLTGLRQSKDLPAVRALAEKISIQKIFNIVDQNMDDESTISRNVKIYLCHNHTGQKLKKIGEKYGIGDSAVSQVCKRLRKKIEQDKQLNKKIRKLEKIIMM